MSVGSESSWSTRVVSSDPVAAAGTMLKIANSFFLIEKTLGCVPMPWNCIKLVTTELGIRKKQCRKSRIQCRKSGK